MSDPVNPPPEAAPPAVPAADPTAEAIVAIRRSASWFYWIAGLSVVNVLTMAFGSNYSMILGSGISQLTQAMAQSYWTSGAAGSAIVFYVLTALFVLAFVLFGWLANKLIVWPFIAGMALYAIDSVIFILASDWVGIAFHAFVLYMLYRGLAALLRLNRAQAPAQA